MKQVFVRSPYNYDMSKASEESGLSCQDPSLTQQQFAEETEIRTIVERFGLTGQLPENVTVPQFGDFTEVTDFHSAMNAVREANEAFLQFPAKVRERFNHDPQRLLEFVSDGSNRDEAIKLGFIDLPPALPSPAEPSKAP